MSVSGALNNALSGLLAAGRASEIVSSNIANALNPEYGPRQIELTSATTATSGGVRVAGVARGVDPFLLSDRRLASAERGFDETQAAYFARVETVLGTPNEPGSLTSRLASFDEALITAASRPEAPERLSLALNAAKDLASGLNRASDNIQKARRDAEFSIDEQVNWLNNALENVKKLNRQIVARQVTGQDNSALQDHRQGIIDEVSKMIPVRIDPRGNGGVALYSTGGAVLLDGNAIELEFSRNSTVTPYNTIDNGSLSGLSINGVAIDLSASTSPLRGGTLIAQFAIRDVLAVESQSQLDALARDLYDRFSDPQVDPTLSSGDPGLFTDAGASFNPLNEVGLSARLLLNAAVDPNQGGETWRLRDGIGSVVPGDAGNAAILQSLSEALTLQRTPASGNFGTGALSAPDLMSVFLSQVASHSLQADQRQTFSSTRHDELVQLERANGVDSDAELQRLILIEQAYAANARIIETADQMLQDLLRI